MRLLGIDYGKKRVGLALSDDKGLMAFPKAVLPNDNFLMREIRDLVKGHGVTKIVVGESKDFKMNENPIMSKIKAFVVELEQDTGLDVVYEPEILSSHQAMQFPGKYISGQAGPVSGKKDMIDASAAAIILQSYIDRNKK